MEKSDASPQQLWINLDHLLHNFQYFKSGLRPETKIMAMVKADAYGCGAITVAGHLAENGVDYLGVAYTQEGIQLREAGIPTPILIMNPLPEEFEKIVAHQLEPEISSPFLLNHWVRFSKKNYKKEYPVHLKIETGMHRLGFPEEDLEELSMILRDNPQIQIRSVMSHLASSPLPKNDSYTFKQFKSFDRMYNRLLPVLGNHTDRHILNSAGIFRFPDHQYEIVRLGIGLYGVGLEDLEIQKHLKPVQSLRVRIAQIKDAAAGEGIGYSRSEVLASPAKIAVLQMGYADGLPRMAGNHHFSVWFKGHLFPITGNVCMDMTMIDVTGSNDIRAGDYVEIYGDHHPVIRLSAATRTIPYENLTANHNRAIRFVIRENIIEKGQRNPV